MAGVSAPPSKSASASPPDWCACVEAFTDKHLERLADWRGFSGEFCSWLKQNRLVGLYEGCIAFPVHDSAGNVAAIHYRLRDGSWRYYPQGVKVRPLVIGELAADGSAPRFRESVGRVRVHGHLRRAQRYHHLARREQWRARWRFATGKVNCLSLAAERCGRREVAKRYLREHESDSEVRKNSRAAQGFE